MKITRRFEFDAGHRVLGHENKCAHLHGHRYMADVTAECRDLDSLGRVIDFSVVKQIVGSWIDENWDHNMILNSEDPFIKMESVLGVVLMKKICAGKAPYIMSHGNPTAENMAMELLIVSNRLFIQYPIAICHVRIWETPNCWADCDASWITNHLYKSQ